MIKLKSKAKFKLFFREKSWTGKLGHVFLEKKGGLGIQTTQNGDLGGHTATCSRYCDHTLHELRGESSVDPVCWSYSHPCRVPFSLLICITSDTCLGAASESFMSVRTWVSASVLRCPSARRCRLTKRRLPVWKAKSGFDHWTTSSWTVPRTNRHSRCFDARFHADRDHLACHHALPYQRRCLNGEAPPAYSSWFTLVHVWPRCTLLHHIHVWLLILKPLRPSPCSTLPFSTSPHPLASFPRSSTYADLFQSHNVLWTHHVYRPTHPLSCMTCCSTDACFLIKNWINGNMIDHGPRSEN